MSIDITNTSNDDLVIPDDDNVYYRKNEEVSLPNKWMMSGNYSSPTIYQEKPNSPIENLRKIGRSLNPRHGDKLYPLEVLGAYHVVLNKPFSWNFDDFGYDPESFVDNNIVEWLNSCDLNKFRNRLERELSENDVVRRIFLLRLNYAILLEQSTDNISIHTKPKSNSLNYYNGVPEEGCDQKPVGAYESSKDLMEDAEGLDKIANEFYSNVEIIKTTVNGTPQCLVDSIKNLLEIYDYDINYNLDEVYHGLNNENKSNLECGLIARIGYLALKSELENSFHEGNPRIKHNQ